MFDECVGEKDGAFDPTTVGCCPNVDLMAPKAMWNALLACARCVVVCVREVASVEEGHDVEHVTEMRRCDTTTATVKLARETDETTSATVKLARETDESTSAMVKPARD